MPNNPAAAIGILLISVRLDEGRNLGRNGMRQKLTRPDPQNLRQGIL